jgi:hypothetical protein
MVAPLLFSMVIEKTSAWARVHVCLICGLFEVAAIRLHGAFDCHRLGQRADTTLKNRTLRMRLADGGDCQRDRDRGAQSLL